MMRAILFIDRVGEFIHRYGEQHAYLRRFLREPKGHETFLTAMLGLRFVMLLGAMLRFGLNKADYAHSPQLFNLALFTLFAIFLYILILARLRVLEWPRFIARKSKLIQVLIDITLFSLLFFLTKDPKSDLFILYFIPLLIVAEYFGLVANICILILTSLSLAASLWAINTVFTPYSTDLLLKVFLPRAGSFLLVAFPYLIHRRLQTPFDVDVAIDRQTLFSYLDKIPDRRDRKLFRQHLQGYTRNVERAAELLGWEVKQKDQLLNRQLSAIFEASRAAFEADEERAISRIVETIGEALGCQAGALRLLGEDEARQPSLVLRASYGYASDYRQLVRYLRTDGLDIGAETFRSKQTRCYHDIQRHKETLEQSDSSFSKFIKIFDLHSLICVPLKFPEGVRGTLTFYRRAVRAFTPDEIKVCEALASYLALTIANFGLYRATLAQAIERKEWLDTLHTLGTQLAGFDDLDTLLQLVADKTREHLNAEVSAIFLIEQDGLRRKAMAGITNSWFADEQYAPGEGLTGRASLVAEGKQYGETILENNVDESTDVLRSNLEKYRSNLKFRTVKHLIAVPLNGRNGPFGVLRVLNKLDDGRLAASGFTKSDAELLYTIGCEVGIAVENARLLAEAQRTLETERRKAREAEAMLKIGQVVSFSLHLDQILQTVVDEMAKVMEVEQAGVVLFDEARMYGYVDAQYQMISDDTAQKVRIPLRDNPSIDQVLRTKQPLAIYDAENDPLTVAIRDIVRLRSIKSILIVPLIVNGEVIGTIGLDATKERRHFTPEEMRLCLLMATQVVMAIENARLFQEAVEQKQRLRDYFAVMGEKFVEHTDVQGLYTFIVHTGAQLSNAEDCSLYLVNDKEHMIDIVASSLLPADLFGRNPTLISAGPRSGLTAYVAATGETLRFVGDDFKRHPAWSGDFQDHLQHFASGACDSLLIAPMKNRRGQTIGTLKIENKLGRERAQGFSAFDAELLAILAYQAASDIERVQEYERMRKEAAQRERERLQGELHEALNILHAGVMLETEAVRYWLGKAQYGLADAGLDRLWKVSRFTYGELSNILQDLRDPVLQTAGLTAALRRYADIMGPDLIIFDSNLQDRLGFDVEYALYRIAQGAISNAVRHAGLGDIPDGRVRVNLHRDAHILMLCIEDNGRGFDLGDTINGNRFPLGMATMQKLAKQLKTDLAIDSQPSIGTTIRIIIPLKEAKNGRKEAKSGREDPNIDRL